MLLTLVGTIGLCAIVPSELEGWNVARAIGVIPLKTNVDKRWVNFALRNQPAQDYIQSHANTTVQATFNLRDLADLPIPMPPDDIRTPVSRFLSNLDDKIELNRRMNETLEAMARAIFKEWFVDFAPTRAKAALKQAAEQMEMPNPSHHPATPHDFHSPLEGESTPKASEGGSHPNTTSVAEPPRHYSQQTLNNAHSLRQNQTNPERLLWRHLRNKQLGGHKFRRQQPIGPYIADFACMPRKLVIELDGGQHSEQHNYDEQRDTYLRNNGFRVLRFWNNEIFENRDGVLETIQNALDADVHSPLEGESARQGRQLGDEPVGGAAVGLTEFEGFPPPTPSASTPPQGGSEWTPERARAYLDRIDPSISELFPDELDDEGKPVGWSIYSLGDLAQHSRATLSPARHSDRLFEHYSIPAFDSGNEPLVELGGSIRSNKTIVPQGAVLLSKLNPDIERVWLPNPYGDLPQIASTEFLALTPTLPVTSSVLYCLFKSPSFRAEMTARVTGTSKSHQRVPPKSLLDCEVLSATPKLLCLV